MKKNKIITISILGLLLLVPFMTPTVAAPASYVPVAEEESYEYYLTINWAAWTTSGFFADGMSDTIGNIFGTPTANRLWQIYDAWDDYYLNSLWTRDIQSILPENTGVILSDYYIFANITYTQMWTIDNYHHFYGSGETPWWASYYIVNDTINYAHLSLYGGLSFSPYTLASVAFAPNNMNWATFAAIADGAMTTYWGVANPLAANTTVTALADGYSIYVPTAGFENNTAPITVNVTFNSNGILNSSSFEYGADVLYTYELINYYADIVAPVVTSPSDFIGLYNPPYTGLNITWTATDAHPGNYTIELDTTEVVAPTPWVSGVPVTYNITDGLALGNHTFVIFFEDMYGHITNNSVVFTVYVPDTVDPVLTSTPDDIIVDIADLYQSFSWTATEGYPSTYTITRNGTEVVAPTAWVSGTAVTYQVDWALHYIVGITTYEITFSDLNGNTVSDTVTMTVNPIPPESTPAPGIPGFEPLIVIGIVTIGSIGLIMLKKKRK